MEDSSRRKLDKFEREQAFMQDNSADFPADSAGSKALAVHTQIIDEMHALAGDQISGEGTRRQSVADKDDAIDEMWEIIRDMNRAANAFEDEVPNIGDKFRLPRNRSQENIAATSRAYIADATPIKGKFIEFGLDTNFLSDLQSYIDDFDAKGTDADSGEGRRASATGGLLDAAKRGMTNSRKLDSIVKIKYKNNAQKLAAWKIASHLEKAPKRKNVEPDK